MMRLVVVASHPREFRGILGHAREVRVAEPQAGWARAAQVGEHAVLMMANGAGAKQAALAVDAGWEFHPDALVSVGFCGALSPELGPADVVVATAVSGEEASYAAKPVMSERNHQAGVVRTIDHVARTAAEKSHWHTRGAMAVDMEAAAVGAAALARQLPFYCIKAVTDLANETLANDLNAALRGDGHFDTIKILGSTLRQPLVRVPELFRLRSRSVRAAQALGDFFADCRF